MSKSKKKVAKKSAKKVTKKVAKSTGNKELDKMLAKITKATKKGEKSVVVFTTSRANHKEGSYGSGFGDSDLLPEYLEAYKHLLCKFDITTKLISIGDMAVEWTVNL